MNHLDASGLAPATMGGAAGQTLGGVISTSVHGSHHLLPPFPDWVRAVHLVGPDGRQYWIEPADRPITKDAELRRTLGPDVEVKRDNDWFDSVLVTVGALGIVYSVVLEVRAAYKVREVRHRHVEWSVLRPLLADGSVFTTDAPEAVQVAINPGSMDRAASLAGGKPAGPDCFLSVRHNVGMTFPSDPPDTSFDAQAAFCETDLLGALDRVASPALWPDAARHVADDPRRGADAPAAAARDHADHRHRGRRADPVRRAQGQRAGRRR